MAFVNLEINFDRVPQKVLWWALRVVGVPEWLLKVVQAMHVGARSRTPGNNPEKISIRKSDAAIPCDFLLKFYVDMKMPKMVSK